MQRHRQVPPIASQRPSIGLDSSGPIPSPMTLGQPQTDLIGDEVRQLALEIYSCLAVGCIERSQPPDASQLRQLAGHAQVAALAYFEVLGVRFDSGPSGG